ncbi:gamma-glutamyltransferase [Bhargavaea cecembensis]|uniref:Glutathione hydrolase proenzyme n=1 Tax=Bhargavaea cecembensis TaxID=394098 RepID=A0A161SPV6_9BACL|nr:gamma-glutamyltransferase [Bhargavaea cecembensis]KZE37210.1 gamma-glutamyltransferase [Bhargavaea cecembensis]
MPEKVEKNRTLFETGRPVARGTNGAVASPHYLATQTGENILRRGGHAVDAAIAANAVLCVVLPHMAGLGGDLFALVRDRNEGEVKSLNGSGRAGNRVSRDVYKENDYGNIPERGPLAAITVPGAVDGWWALHYEYGKLDWPTLFEDAIHYAEEGFPVTDKLSGYIADKVDLLREFATAGKVYLKDGQPLSPGEQLVQPDLAWSLKQIQRYGKEAFYNGAITDKIIKAMEEYGGLLTREDFEKHTSEWDEPLSATYRGYDIFQVKLNTQGIAVLMMLNMLEKYDLQSIQDGSADYYHLLAETAKLKFRYRDEWVTDPETIDLPYERLLSKSFSAEVNQRFSWEEAFPTETLEDLPDVKPGRDTAYLCVADREGNCISLIQSIYHEFGSGFMPEGCGFLIHNRGSHFSLEASHPNSLEPNKRTFHTIIPGMALKDGKPFMLFGSMGGEGQPQTQCAMLTRVIDFGYDMQQAIEAPRWLYGRTWGADSSTLKLEGRVPDDVIEELKGRGHEVEVVDNFDQVMGHAQGILIDPKTGIYSAGADPRGDGIALCW